MRPVSPYDVVQPNLLATGPTGVPLPGRGTTEAVLGNPAHGFLPAVAAALGLPQGLPTSGATAPDYGLLTGTSSNGSGSGSASGGGSSSGGACGCG